MMECRHQVERLDALSPDRFHADRVPRDEPVVIAGALAGWPALSAWTPSRLIERLADTPVRLASSARGVFDYDPVAASTFTMERVPFREAAARVLAAMPGAPRPYVMQLSLHADLPALVPDAPPPALLRGIPAAPYFWFGAEGNVTPLHYDPVNNLYAQIHGRKRFILFHPKQSELLYPFPVTARYPHVSHVDVEQPELSRFPRFREAQPMECVLGPGDILFLPAFWWHHVRSLDVAVSVNYWWAPRFEQCLAPASLRVFRALYARDRLTGVGEPFTSLPGGFMGAARRAHALGHVGAAALFAGVALERAARALCRSRGIPDRDGDALRPLAALQAELVEAAVISSREAQQVAHWAAWAERAATGDERDFTVESVAQMLDAIAALGWS